MNIVQISQIVGVVAIFLLFSIKFYIAINKKFSAETLRAAILWTTMYIFFLFILRLFSLLHIGTLDQLRVISGLSSVIPLLGVISQLYLNRKLN